MEHAARQRILRGSLGETQAVHYLRSIGYAVLARNVRIGKDEIDVVAFDPFDRVVAFVEVKTRFHGATYHPSLNMTAKKRSCMRRAARRWVWNHGYEGGFRLDAAYVLGQQVEHVVDVDPLGEKE